MTLASAIQETTGASKIQMGHVIFHPYAKICYPCAKFEVPTVI